MTHIWVPRMRIIEPKREIVIPTRLQGFFKLEVHGGRRGHKVLADWFPNLITDAGLNVIGTSSAWLTACRVGTGNATPSTADTALESQIAGTSTRQDNNTSALNESPYYASRTITYRFGAGAAAGNIAEVGIGTAATGGTLFSRALILDGEGNPTTITVLSDEVLDIVYQIRVYPPLSDVEDEINISGTPYNYTLRAADAGSATRWALAETGARGGINSVTGVGSRARVYNGSIGAITGTPSGTSSQSTSSDDIPYGNNDLYRDFSFTWGLNSANFMAGISATHTTFGTADSFGAIQIGFSPAIPKNNTQTLTLIFRHQWARRTI